MENVNTSEQITTIDEATYIIRRHFGERDLKDLMKELVIKEARKKPMNLL